MSPVRQPRGSSRCIDSMTASMRSRCCQCSWSASRSWSRVRLSSGRGGAHGVRRIRGRSAAPGCWVMRPLEPALERDGDEARTCEAETAGERVHGVYFIAREVQGQGRDRAAAVGAARRAVERARLGSGRDWCSRSFLGRGGQAVEDEVGLVAVELLGALAQQLDQRRGNRDRAAMLPGRFAWPGSSVGGRGAATLTRARLCVRVVASVATAPARGGGTVARRSGTASPSSCRERPDFIPRVSSSGP